MGMYMDDDTNEWVIVGRDTRTAVIWDARRMALARAPRDVAERALRYAHLSHGELEIAPEDREVWEQVKSALEQTGPASGLRTPTVVTQLALGNTYHCNMGCTYCYNELSVKDRKGSEVREGMTLDTARASVAALLEQCGEATSISIIFVGGEPLLEKASLFSTVDYARTRAAEAGKRLSIAIYTNGTLMTEEVVRWASENRVSLVVSIDGPPLIHDRNRLYLSGRPTSKAILRNVRRLSEAGTQQPMRVRSVAVARTALVALHRYFLDLGFNEIHVQPAYGEHGIDEGGSPEEMLALLDWYHEQLLEGVVIGVMPFEGFIERLLMRGSATASWYPCSAGRNFLAVGPNGKVYPCHHFLEESAFELGDVREGLPGLSEREPFFLRVDQREPCRSCWARHACGGECYHRAHTAGVGYTGVLPEVCRQRKSIIGMTLEVLADVAKRRPDVLSALVRKHYTRMTPRWEAYEYNDLSPYPPVPGDVQRSPLPLATGRAHEGP